MRFFVVFITLCYFLVPIHGYCDGLTAEKKAAIKKMLQLTGASEMGTLMGTAIAQNLIQTYKRSNPDIDPKAFDIINDVKPVYKNQHEIRQEVADDFQP